MKPRTKGQLAHRVYHRVKQMIITLELKPGQVIDEKTLEQQLGIGRTPIREALLTLKVEKFIEGNPNKPFYVREIGLKSVRDLFEVLIPVEKLATSLAGQRIRQDSIEELKALNQRIRQAIDQRQYWELTSHNRTFHRLIAHASDNEYIFSIHENLRNQAERLSYLAISAEVQDGPVQEHNERIHLHHETMVTLLEQRNAAQLEKLAEEHVRLFQARILKYLRDV